MVYIRKIFFPTFFILLSISQITCDSTNKKNTKYYGNGNIKSEWFPEQGLLVEYYENGTIKEKGFFHDDKYLGWASYYDKNGLLEIKRHYILVDTASYLNEVIYFDKNGDTLKQKSNYYTLFTPHDTIKIGDEFFIRIKLDAPYFNDRMAVFIADFDSLYRISDTALITVRVGHNFIVNYSYKPIKQGQQYLRGYISDYTIIRKDTSEYTNERLLYFTKTFFVEDSIRKD